MNDRELEVLRECVETPLGSRPEYPTEIIESLRNQGYLGVNGTVTAEGLAALASADR